MRHKIYYTGPSMKPTLRTGDRLEIVPYGCRSIRIGDVILFKDPEKHDIVVHRVIRLNRMGVKTMGDNNGQADPYFLKKSDIFGRVVSALRAGRSIPIHGGTSGRLIGLCHRARRKFDSAVSGLLHPFYHDLAASGLFMWVRRYLPETRILEFQKHNGTEYQLLLGNRIIGRRLPGRRSWQIVRPFRIFLDENSFPK